MQFRYDPEADVLFFQFQPEEQTDRARELDGRRYVHERPDGSPVAVELLFVSEGVDLTDIPRAHEIRACLQKLDSLALA